MQGRSAETGISNLGQLNLSGSQEFLISTEGPSGASIVLEELLITLPTVDGVMVNKDLIQEVTHRFTANPTLEAVLVAADTKVLERNLGTVLDLLTAVSTDPSSYSAIA